MKPRIQSTARVLLVVLAAISAYAAVTIAACQAILYWVQ
jgi:hypothetical protein